VARRVDVADAHRVTDGEPRARLGRQIDGRIRRDRARERERSAGTPLEIRDDTTPFSTRSVATPVSTRSWYVAGR